MLLSRAAIYLEEVGRRGSMRRASETLNVSVSSIDRQILMLERHLGTALFERLPRGLRLTPAGALVAETIRASQHDIDRVRSRIEALDALQPGIAAIGVCEGLTGFVAHALRALNDSHRGTNFTVRVMSSDVIVANLLSGDVDIGLCHNPADGPGLRIERTIACKIGAAVLPDHALAEHTVVALEDCAAFPLILPDASKPLRTTIDRAWQAAALGPPPAGVMTTNSVEMMKSMALDGLGVALLTDREVFAERRDARLRFVPFSDRRTSALLSILRLVDKPLTTMEMALLERLVMD